MYQRGRFILLMCHLFCVVSLIAADGYDFNTPMTNFMQLPAKSSSSIRGDSNNQFLADEINSYADISQEIPQGYDYQPYKTFNVGVDGDSGFRDFSSSGSAGTVSDVGAANVNTGTAGSVNGVSNGRVNGVGSGRIRHSGAISVQLPILRDETSANYEYSYGIHDESSGDIKSHSESRIGDLVRGVYSLIDADGYRRTVTYTVDGDTGFNAIVDRTPIGVVSTNHKNAPTRFTQSQIQHQQQQQQHRHHQLSAPEIQQISVADAKEQQNFIQQTAYDSYAASPLQEGNGPYS